MARHAIVSCHADCMNHFQTLLFASSNAHKLHEIRALLPASIHIQGLHDIGWNSEIPEPFNTFEENAATKATWLFEKTGIPCFAEDSGLEVDSLDGRPGVFSARYAGGHGNAEANINKLLQELGDSTNRTARFVAVIAFPVSSEEVLFFKGTVDGSIAFAASGASGFGYDPVFIPRGFKHTFGELPASIKQAISHRRKALISFIEYLQASNP